jgi:hypothetical protein
VHDLHPRSPIGDWAVAYLYHEVEVPQAVVSELSLGSDDTITVWLNGKRILSHNVIRGAEPDQEFAILHLQPGKNQLLIKICQGGGGWGVYVMPRWPELLRHRFQSSLDRDFPPSTGKGPLVYLADLSEREPNVGHGQFGKKGNLGYDNARIKVNGAESPNGLSMHPPGDGAARVHYQLGKQYQSFKAKAAIDDTGAAGGLHLTFMVLGDGKVLWKSNPLQKQGESQECQISVAGVDRLELQVECKGSHNSAHAVWIDPAVSR